MFKRPVTGRQKASSSSMQNAKKGTSINKTEQSEIDIVAMIQKRDFSGAIAVLEVCIPY